MQLQWILLSWTAYIQLLQVLEFQMSSEFYLGDFIKRALLHDLFSNIGRLDQDLKFAFSF